MSPAEISAIVTGIVAGVGAVGGAIAYFVKWFLRQLERQTDALIASVEKADANREAQTQALVGIRIDLDELRRREAITGSQLDAIYAREVGSTRPSEFGRMRAEVSQQAQELRELRRERGDDTLRTQVQKVRRATGT